MRCRREAIQQYNLQIRYKAIASNLRRRHVDRMYEACTIIEVPLSTAKISPKVRSQILGLREVSDVDFMQPDLKS